MQQAVPRPDVYLDHAATGPLDPRVRAAMEPWLAGPTANPSSTHAAGVRAREAVDQARARVARAVGGDPSQVVFTSGGTEANNLAVLGLARARARSGRHVLIGPTEHSCVRGAAEALVEEGFEIEVVDGDADGVADVLDLEQRLRPDTVLVALMVVSNELGTRQPVPAVARTLRRTRSRALLHVDAVQGLGKVPLDLHELGASSLALAGHKVGGPQGTGALVLAPGVRPRPLVHGGGQESGLRSGTENVAGCVGLGVAAGLADGHLAANDARLTELRARLEAGLAALPGIEPLVDPRRTVPSILTLRVPGPPASVWQHHLADQGVLVGLGSACQARAASTSPTWSVVGLDAEGARQVLRLSLGPSTTRAEVEAALRALACVSARLDTAGARIEVP